MLNLSLTKGIRFYIGVPFDDTGSTDGGITYLFDAIIVDLLTTIHKPPPSDDDRFGFAITSAGINNDILVIGAPRDDIGALRAGSANVFEITTSP